MLSRIKYLLFGRVSPDEVARGPMLDAAMCDFTVAAKDTESPHIEADEVFIRLWHPPSDLDKHVGNRLGHIYNLHMRDAAYAREYALDCLRKFAIGDRSYRPIAIIHVRWKGTLRRAIDEGTMEMPR